MKIAARLFENLLQDGFYGEGDSLPFLWQVIYHEATRANHLVFEREDVERFDKDCSKFQGNESGCKDKLGDVMLGLLSCNDLDKIKDTIKELPYGERKQVFALYKRFIERWRYQIKQSLN